MRHDPDPGSPLLSGPRSFYRPKESRPTSVNLTAVGRGILAAVAERTRASRSDIVEQLLRRFAHTVKFPPEDKT